MVFENELLTVDGTTYTFQGGFRVEGNTVFFDAESPLGKSVELVYTVGVGHMPEEQLRAALDDESVSKINNSKREFVVRDSVLDTQAVLRFQTLHE